MVCNREIKAMLEGQHQNPLAAYSTLQLKEELSRRRRGHLGLQLRVKLQLLHRPGKIVRRQYKG